MCPFSTLVLPIRGHPTALKGEHDEELEAGQLVPPLLLHHRDIVPPPSLPKRLDSRHLRETTQEGDGEWETVEGVDELLTSLVARSPLPLARHSYMRFAASRSKVARCRNRGQHPRGLLRSFLTTHGGGDVDGRKCDDIRKQELNGAPAEPGLVPQRVKVFQIHHTALGQEHREHAGLEPLSSELSAAVLTGMVEKARQYEIVLLHKGHNL